ncbi:uncharacterized protein LOC110860744 isoform X1 [Folsomia candida]|uniref:uncharacterized protein LOC110860744 isoform X1 n=1 Tax=Folsomia candida TaxID=158441 RepID=UPI00160513E2|nr:uncharacterized protein LOC110860744 isoform X1 [Folsomia candida]
MENNLKDLASDDEKITSEQVPEDAPVSANERPKRGKPDLDGKAGSSSKPSTAQKLKKFICKRRKIEKSSQAPLASGVEFSSSGTSSSSASSSDNEGAHGTDLTAVCGDNDGKPDGITNAQKVFFAVFGISPTPKPAGTNQIGWPDRGFELSDQGAFVRKDYFVMCTLKYWYTEIPKILKRNFKIINSTDSFSQYES